MENIDNTADIEDTAVIEMDDSGANTIDGIVDEELVEVDELDARESTKSQYENLKSLMGTIRETLDMFKEQVRSTQANLDSSNIKNHLTLRVLSKLSLDEVKSMTIENVYRLFKDTDSRCTDTDGSIMTEKEVILDTFTLSPQLSDEEILGKVLDELINVRELQDTLMEAKEMETSTTKELNEAVDQFMKHMTSSKHTEAQKKHIENLKKALEEDKDKLSAEDIKDMNVNISNLEAVVNLKFLLDGIVNLDEREVLNISDIFFSPSRSEVVVNKFYSVLKKVKLEKTTINVFFNLEEKFLEERYHPFNNLFIIYVMRVIGYMDGYDKATRSKVSAIITHLYNLVYHNFETQELEDEFISIIRAFDDKALSLSDTFKEKNITCPTHPRRVGAKEEMNKKIKADEEFDKKAFAIADSIKETITILPEFLEKNDDDTTEDDITEEGVVDINEDDISISGRGLLEPVIIDDEGTEW